eukprot:8939393-Pyramimonas_sp.AAC.1
MWGPIVETWGSCNYGVRLEDEGTQQALVNHYLWADNVVLVSASANQLKKMVSMLTVALRRAGMDWKIESLECIVFGLRQDQGAQSLICELGDDICMQAGDPGQPYQLRGA